MRVLIPIPSPTKRTTPLATPPAGALPLALQVAADARIRPSIARVAPSYHATLSANRNFSSPQSALDYACLNPHCTISWGENSRSSSSGIFLPEEIKDRKNFSFDHHRFRFERVKRNERNKAGVFPSRKFRREDFSDILIESAVLLSREKKRKVWRFLSRRGTFRAIR